MKQAIFLTALLGFVTFSAFSQSTPTYRLKFRYIITQRKLNKLNSGTPSVFITNTNATTVPSYTICTSGNSKFLGVFSRQHRFRTLITNTAGDLKLDPWSVKNTPSHPDPCLGISNVINANTPVGLHIQLPARTIVGDPTVSTWFHYQSFVVGVNTFSLKIRPSVKDEKDSTYTRSITSGSFNLGINLGYSLGWTQFTSRSTNSYSITPGLNFGFSGSTLTPLSRPLKITYIPSNYVVSPAFSLIIARNDIGIIAALGIEHMYGKYAEYWLYQDKLFFGIGVSASLKL